MNKFFLLLCLSINAYSANDNLPVGARSAGLSNASVCVQDIWAVQHNQAGLANLKSLEIAISSQSLFANEQILLNAVAIAAPTKYGVFAFNVNRLGFKNLYTDSKYGLAYSRLFGKIISAGMQIDYLSTFIGDNYGTRGTFTMEAGMMAEIIKNLRIGFHIYNPIHAKTADYNNERVPVIIRLGMQYTFSKNVFMAIETEKDIVNKPIFKVGLEYHIAKAFYLRGGISSNPALNAFGFGLELNKLTIDFAASFNLQLGISPHIGLKYCFNYLVY